MDNKRVLMIDHIDVPQNLIVIEKASETIYLGPDESSANSAVSADDDVNEAAFE